MGWTSIIREAFDSASCLNSQFDSKISWHPLIPNVKIILSLAFEIFLYDLLLLGIHVICKYI